MGKGWQGMGVAWRGAPSDPSSGGGGLGWRWGGASDAFFWLYQLVGSSYGRTNIQAAGTM